MIYNAKQLIKILTSILVYYLYYCKDLPLAHMPMNVPQCLITTSTNGLAVSMCSLLSIYHRKSWAVIADTSHFKMLNRSSSHICKPNDGVIAYTMFIHINNNYNNNSSSSNNNNNQLTRHLTTTSYNELRLLGSHRHQALSSLPLQQQAVVHQQRR